MKIFRGCFSYKCTGYHVLVEGMIYSQKCKDLLNYRLESKLRKVDANDQAVFQQESVPNHVSKIMMKYYSKNTVNLMVIHKARFRKNDCTTQTKLKMV